MILRIGPLVVDVHARCTFCGRSWRWRRRLAPMERRRKPARYGGWFPRRWLCPDCEDHVTEYTAMRRARWWPGSSAKGEA